MKKSLEAWCLENNRKDILDVWDYENNKDLKPSKISFGSHQEICWFCKIHNKTWKKSINRMTSNKTNGCKYCEGSYDFKYWCLNNGREDLLKEWDYELNKNINIEEITFGSHKKVYWICSNCKKSYKSVLRDRTQGNTGCNNPNCISEKISKNLKNSLLIKYGSLEDNNPEIAEEWDYELNYPLTPKDICKCSKDLYWFKCKNGHNPYQMTPGHRTNMGCGCPECSNNSHKVIIGFNDLKSHNPDVANEWNYEKNSPLKPEDVSYANSKKVWFTCNQGHSYITSISNRTISKSGCPDCNNQSHTSFPEQTILYYLRKTKLEIINSYKPDWIGKSEIDIYIPSLNIGIEYDGIKWHKDKFEKDNEKNKLCKENNLKLIRIREEGLDSMDNCICIFRKNIANILSLEDVLKELLKILNLKEEFNVDIDRDRNIIEKEYKTYLEKEKSLFNTHPQLAKEWDYNKNGKLTPKMVTKGMDKKVYWICPKCNESYLASIKSRASMKIGHKDCNYKWLEKYQLAKDFYENNQHLNIFTQYETEEGVKLGTWIQLQRKAYKNNKLSKEKIKLLEDIGMIWSFDEAQWQEKYTLAKQYYEEFENLLISQKYETKDGIKLGIWIGLQRTNYKKNKLSQDKIKLLESIGMVWSIK